MQIFVSKGGTHGNGNKVKPERQQHSTLSPVVIAPTNLQWQDDLGVDDY